MTDLKHCVIRWYFDLKSEVYFCHPSSIKLNLLSIILQHSYYVTLYFLTLSHKLSRTKGLTQHYKRYLGCLGCFSSLNKHSSNRRGPYGDQRLACNMLAFSLHVALDVSVQESLVFLASHSCIDYIYCFGVPKS